MFSRPCSGKTLFTKLGNNQDHSFLVLCMKESSLSNYNSGILFNAEQRSTYVMSDFLLNFED